MPGLADGLPRGLVTDWRADSQRSVLPEVLPEVLPSSQQEEERWEDRRRKPGIVNSAFSFRYVVLQINALSLRKKLRKY